MTDQNLETPGSGDQEQRADDFWSVVTPEREPVSYRWFLPAVIAILTLATPWYLPTEIASRLVGGLPVWVWVALVGALALSVLTSIGALFLWRDRADESGERGADGS